MSPSISLAFTVIPIVEPFAIFSLIEFSWVSLFVISDIGSFIGFIWIRVLTSLLTFPALSVRVYFKYPKSPFIFWVRICSFKFLNSSKVRVSPVCKAVPLDFWICTSLFGKSLIVINAIPFESLGVVMFRVSKFVSSSVVMVWLFDVVGAVVSITTLCSIFDIATFPASSFTFTCIWFSLYVLFSSKKKLSSFPICQLFPPSKE